MKRLLASALAAASISAFAAWEHVGAIQVADMVTLGEASSKLGQMVGNPMVAAGVASAIADMPTLKFFGPMRQKTTTVLTLLVDSDSLAKDPEKAFDDLKYAILYPISLTKDEFIKRHAGASETNGVVVVNGDIDGSDKDDEKTYVVFSPDGKWVGASDNVEQCHAALGDVAIAERSMDGEVVRLMLDPSALDAISSLASKHKDITPDVLAYIKSINSCAAGIRVFDGGIDVVAGVKVNDGSMLSQVGFKPLAADPLAFAGKSAVNAASQAEDSGSRCDMTAEQWSRLLGVFKKHEIDVAAFLARESADGKSVYTFDIAALLSYCEKMEGLVKFDCEKFFEDLTQAFKDDKIEVKGPACSYAFTVKGFESQWSVAERYTATLPEAAAKKPFSVGFASISSFVKAIVPHAVAQIPAERREIMKPIFDSLAVEQKRGIASACWREGDDIKAIVRVSSDEIRGLGGVFAGVMSLYAMNPCGGSACELDDDDLDDDDDDEDDDN